jgi:microcin C transport system permease protein
VLRYLLRRLSLIPLTFLGITFVAFLFTRFVPGGPIEQALAERQQAAQKRLGMGGAGASDASGPASPEEIDNLKRRYGFDRPLLEAYAIWLGAWPGPADWVTVRLKADGTGEAELPAATPDNPKATRKVALRTEGGKPLIVDSPAGWVIEPAPLADDPNPAPRVVLYRPEFSGILQLDLGKSSVDDRPVWDILVARFPVSAWFGFWSILLAYLVSIPLGMAKAMAHGRAFDSASSGVLFVLYAIPGFVLAVALQQWLCFHLGWFPHSGFERTWHYTALPLACMSVGSFTLMTLFVKNSLLDNLSSDHVRTARAKGLGRWRVLLLHGLRNSLIPLAANFGQIIGFFLTGSFLIEVTFDIPGMGLVSYDALVQRNFPVFLGILTLSSLLMLVGNILSDLCLAAADPRIRFDKSA